MHHILILICIILSLISIYVIVNLKGFRKELPLLLLSGLFVSYPLKAYLLEYNSDLFSTYHAFFNISKPFESYLAYIIFTSLFLFGYAIHKPIKIHCSTNIIEKNNLWSYINILNAIFLITAAVKFSEIQSITELLSATSRRQFLDAQQGNGWSSLLIIFSIPLLAVGFHTEKKLLFYLSIFFTLTALLIIGSRLYLFAYIIAFVICFWKLSVRRLFFLLLALGAIGSFIYLGFIGNTNNDINLLNLLAFLMHTFDGADILNAYCNSSDQKIYFGSTVLEDLAFTYYPRGLWESKPYLFGAIRITTDLFSDLSDVQALGATFPPGLFLELYANFSIFALFIPILIGISIARISNEYRHATNPLNFALYVSLCAMAPGFFRGLGSVISFIVPVFFLFLLLGLLKRLRF